MSFIIIVTVTACNFLMHTDDGRPFCRDFQLPRVEVEHQPTPMQCFMNGQLKVIKEWLPSHPDWQIQKLKCSYTNDKNHIEGDI